MLPRFSAKGRTKPNRGTAMQVLVEKMLSDFERGVLSRGDRVAWLGIGSGLNCLMLGIEW